MNIKLVVKMRMTLFHGQTMKEMHIDQSIEKCYNEESEEYQSLCEEYRNVVGFEREENEDEFDKQLMLILAEKAKDSHKETVRAIEETVKNCYYRGTTAYILFGGYMINPKDFCAIRMDGLDIQINKK